MRTVIISLLLLTAPVFSFAQGGFELTPTAGFRWGGELNTGYSDVFGVDVDVEEGSSFGLIFDADLNRWLFLEVMVDHQNTELGTGDLFEPDEIVAGVDIDYYHVGLGWQWSTGTVRPFLIGSMGWTTISPDLAGLRDEDRFSMSLGGGVKMDVNEHVGFRLELRTYWTDTSDDEWWDDDEWWEDDCHRHDCDDHWDGWDDLGQAQIRVGVIFRF